MEQGDYIQIGGALKRIKTTSGEVIDIATQRCTKEKISSCHISITPKILEACGFEKEDDGYITRLNADNGDSYMVIGKLRPLDHEYILYTTKYLESDIRCQIMTLSVLQDWIRLHTGLELNINEKELMNIVNR